MPAADDPATGADRRRQRRGHVRPVPREVARRDRRGHDAARLRGVHRVLPDPTSLDWPAKFRSIIPSIDPDIVIVTFGGNDAQGLAEACGNFIVGQPTGERRRRRRSGAPSTAAASARSWTTCRPRVARSSGSASPTTTTPTSPRACACRTRSCAPRPPSGRRSCSSTRGARFSGREGNWAEYVIDPRDGQGKDVRADDGFHLNVTGAEILALDIAEAVRQELRNRGAVVLTAPDPRSAPAQAGVITGPFGPMRSERCVHAPWSAYGYPRGSASGGDAMLTGAMFLKRAVAVGALALTTSAGRPALHTRHRRAAGRTCTTETVLVDRLGRVRRGRRRRSTPESSCPWCSVPI